MGVFLETLAVLAVIVFAGLGLAALYHLIMGALQKDKKQLIVGVAFLAGFVACAFIGLLFIANLMKGMC